MENIKSLTGIPGVLSADDPDNKFSLEPRKKVLDVLVQEVTDVDSLFKYYQKELIKVVRYNTDIPHPEVHFF